MSNSSRHTFSKTNLIQNRDLKTSEPLLSSDAPNKNVTSKINKSKCTTAGTSHSNTKKTGEFVSTGHSYKYCINDEYSKDISVNKSRNVNPVKYNEEKHIMPSSSKHKNNSSFSVFSQLLNKRPNDSSTPNSPSESNSYLQFQKLKQDSLHLNEKNEGLESSDSISRGLVKTKLKSMWSNVKYGWKMKREVNLKTDSAIWLLGQCYHSKLNDNLDLCQDVGEQLRQDLLSKIWLTYRINFPVIPGTNLVTDSGWGCMLRCGQMMMAQAFVCHFLKRDWRLFSHESEDKNQMYKTILRWFGDSMSDKSPFSLHHLVTLGKNYGRKAGDWYGPTHVAHVLRDALNKAKQDNPLLSELCMHVASDGIVFKQDVMDLCSDLISEKENNSSTSLSSDFATISLTETHENSSRQMLKDSILSDIPDMNLLANEEPNISTNEEPISFETGCPSYSDFEPPSYSIVKPKWKSLILFVSVRLGNDKMNPFYIPCLKSLLAYEHCIGIIGGRPKHALYFIGWQDDKIIHMDPHSCQPAIDVEKEDFSEKSFHSSSVRMMSFTEMDPSCSIGFYFRELEEFQIFIEKFAEITAPLKRNLEYPIFALADGKRIQIQDDLDHPNEKHIYPPLSISQINDNDVDDDYILL